MVFSSIPFLFYFLPCVLIAYYLVPKSLKTQVLLLASLVFYAWGEPSLVFLMLLSIALGYVFGILIERFRGTPWAKICLLLSLGISVSFLGYFKYANFFISNFNRATGLDIPFLKVVLPIGISFYTFQLMSYIMDVYWEKVRAQKNLFQLATYIAMFPQLIAGPIVRYTDVEKQLSDRTITYEKVSYGIRRFVLGLGKKVLIANLLGEFCTTFKATEEKTVIFFWAYAVAISLQIYFDFSGYSDMAIGLGSMLGFHFMENFNYPFIAKSITEFWRRWHISLGTWFRDYVYIPLGGSRKNFATTLRNIFIVWMLTGLWHGADWTFVIWGMYFGCLLILEKAFLLNWLEKHDILGRLYTVFLCLISFVIFDGDSLWESLQYITALFGGGDYPVVNEITLYYLCSYFVIFVIALIGATPLPKRVIAKCMEIKRYGDLVSFLEPVFMVILLLVVTAYLVDGSFNPFLYFRF